MGDHASLTGAHRLWLRAATASAPFPFPGETRIVVAPDSRLCPSGWIGIVHLAGATLVTVPSQHHARTIPASLPAAAWADPAHLRQSLPLDRVLGPASLAYRDTPPPGPTPTTVETLDAPHPDLSALLSSVPPEEAEESGLAEITSPAFVLRHNHQVTAAAGYRHWPEKTAHLSVLTAPTHRNQGLARRAAHAATTHCTTHGLLAQWRASHTHSQRIALSLGFTPLGIQLSIQPQT